MGRAAAYLRVSTEMQDKNSIDAQRSKIEEAAKVNGDRIVELVVEDPKSATTSDREKLRALIRNIKSSRLKVEKLYVLKLSRFMRSLEESILIRLMLQSHGVEIVSVLEPIPDDGPVGKMVSQILALIDEFTSDVIGMHVMVGMQELARRGYWTGGPAPFGYRLMSIPNREGHQTLGQVKMRAILIQEESEAKIVRRAFELAAEHGWGGQRISDELSKEMGEPVLGRKNKPLGGRGINAILRKTIYKGLFIYNQYGSKNIYREDEESERRVSKRRVTKDKKDWIESQIEEWRLVSDEVWNAAQQNRLHNIRETFGFGPKPPAYALTGLIVCGACGNSCGGHWQHSKNLHYYYYRCRAAMNGERCCENKAKIRGKELENALISAIEQDLFSEKFFEHVSREMHRLSNESCSRQEDKSELAKKHADLTLQVSRMIELAARVSSLDDIPKKLEHLQRERDQIEARMNSLIPPVPKLEPHAIAAKVAAAKAGTLDLIKDADDIADLRKVLGLWIDKVKIDPDGKVFVRWKPKAVFEVLGIEPMSDEGEAGSRFAFIGYCPISYPDLVCNSRCRIRTDSETQIIGFSGQYADSQSLSAMGYSGFSGWSVA